MSAEARQIDQSAPADLAQSILDAHDGDALAALRTVIDDATYLHDQLYTASRLISPGFVRGWRPKLQRGE